MTVGLVIIIDIPDCIDRAEERTSATFFFLHLPNVASKSHSSCSEIVFEVGPRLHQDLCLIATRTHFLAGSCSETWIKYPVLIPY